MSYWRSVLEKVQGVGLFEMGYTNFMEQKACNVKHEEISQYV